MGRSTTSCFKIISCGGNNDSVDRDDIDASSENKGQDKRGWSFRKRSARHRVLSNTVVTEPPSSEIKPSPEPVTIISETQVNPSISEKTCDSIWTEELPNSIPKDATVSTMATEPVCENEIKSDSIPDESAILVIQAAVRRFLAQREFVRCKSVVKLQAAVRGHLVRNHAVGTLRCVQSIVKMQSLVRARHAERSSVGEKGVQNPGSNSHPTYIDIEKLLRNRLARQLLESAAKTKQINIKCVPSKSDSAWNWLERWMSVSSPGPVESHAPEQDHQEKVNNTDTQVETLIPSQTESTERESNDVESIEMASDGVESTIPSDEQENSVKTLENTQKPEELTESKVEKDQIEMNSVPEKPISETESKKRLATDQADSEGRKSVFGSRKASNPAFIAAQSRFEELTSKNNNNPSKSTDLSKQENDVTTPLDISDPLKPVENPSNQDNEASSSTPEEHPVPPTSREVPNGGSECGTELSITSTLDSPDQSDIGIKKPEEDNISNEAKIEEHKIGEDIETEKPTPSEADVELEPESGDQIYKNTHMEIELEDKNAPRISPEASPRSHITLPESQGTPSSEVSSKKTKSDNNKKISSSQKRKSWSSSKKSGGDSGLKSGDSGLGKDFKESKPGKRRNSFGSPRPDHSDQEGKDGNSGSIPSYMQATESARAKAIANSSPRSSPDVQDKEVYLKKRHSLPGAVNGRQASPRIQRSMSQALESTKGNGNQERKWQR